MLGYGGRGGATSVIVFLCCASQLDARAEPVPEPVRVGLRIVERHGRAYVDAVVPGLPAARAGVEVGHELLSVDGEPVANREQARRLLAQFAMVDLLVLRLQPPAHERIVVVGAAPVRGETSGATTTPPRPYLGMSLAEGEDVLVIDVIAPGSPAAVAGVRIGDALLSLDGEPFTREVALRARIAALVPGQSVRLVTRGPPRSIALEKPSGVRRALAPSIDEEREAASPAARTPEPRHASAERRKSAFIGQGGFGAFGNGVAAGNATAVGGGVAGRVRGLFGALPGPEGGAAFALDIGAELFLSVISVDAGSTSAVGFAIGARTEAGFFVGGFQPATADGQPGFGLRVTTVGTFGAVIMDGRTGEGVGFGVQAGLEFARFSAEGGRLRSVVVYALIPVPQDAPTGTGGLQFMF